MIRAHFGLQKNPFDAESLALLPHQQEVFDILQVHAQQGGLCLVLGEPGTGKSVLKQSLLAHDPKRLITPVVNRTLHTYHPPPLFELRRAGNTSAKRHILPVLRSPKGEGGCEAFQIECNGRDHACERLLVQEAFRVHRSGKMLVPIVDDAHLMQSDCLRKLRLLCEDFPRSHNLVLIGQPPLLQSLALSINEEIRSRVTYSVVLPRLAPEAIEAFILAELDRCGLGHNTFTADALALIVRSGEGLLRRTKTTAIIGAVFFATLFLVGNVIRQSTRERTSQFGMLKTLGFSDTRVLAIVAGEALLLCLMGALVGLVGTVVIFPMIANYLPNLSGYLGTPKLSGVVLLFGVLAAGVLTILSAAQPALAAMRLNIVEALRMRV